MSLILKLSVLAATSLFLFSCTTTAPQKKPPEKASPNLQKEYAQAQIDSAAGGKQKAIVRLKKIVQSHPATDVASDSNMMMGKIYYESRDYTNAYASFIAIVNSDTFSPSEGEALLWASRSLHKLGRIDEALSLTQKSAKIPGLSNELKLEFYRLRFQMLSDLGDRLDALKTLVYLSANDTDPAQRESARLRANELVESKLTEEELSSVARSTEYGWVRGSAYFRLANIYFEQKDFSRARDSYSEVITFAPNTEMAIRAKERMDQIEARRRVDSETIGAILPLTGKYSAMGYKTLRGLQLGLGVYGPDKSSLRLAIIDEEGNPDAARRGVERLVAEDHVLAIVGSLLSKTAVAVASKSDEMGVPSIALSQKAGLTDVGPMVFRNSMTSEMQVRQLVRSAMEDLGLRRFAILYPNDPYGIEYANLFWDEVLARGGTITGAQSYAPNDTDFASPIQRLVGTYYYEDRADEYRTLLKEWQKKQKSVNTRNGPPEDLLPPVIDFQAIFIPDSIKALGQISPMLAVHDITDVRLLGTNLWNTEGFSKRADRFADGSLFVDSFIASDDSFKKTKFFRDFKTAFNEEPGLFEAIGYDAGLMIRQALASGERSRVGLAQWLSKMQNFPGSMGGLTISNAREVIRPVSTLTHLEGQVVKLDPAVLPASNKPMPKTKPTVVPKKPRLSQ